MSLLLWSQSLKRCITFKLVWIALMGCVAQGSAPPSSFGQYQVRSATGKSLLQTGAPSGSATLMQYVGSDFNLVRPHPRVDSSMTPPMAGM